MVRWCLIMQTEHDVFNHETIEWGIYRESPYVRQRKAFREMEDIKNGKQCSSSNTDKRSD